MTREDVHAAVGRRERILMQYYLQREFPWHEVVRTEGNVGVSDYVAIDGRTIPNADALDSYCLTSDGWDQGKPLPSTVIAGLASTEGAFYARGWLQGFLEASKAQDLPLASAGLPPEMPDHKVDDVLYLLAMPMDDRMRAYTRGLREGWHHFYAEVWVPDHHTGKED